jgi:hypothetical protein
VEAHCRFLSNLFTPASGDHPYTQGDEAEGDEDADEISKAEIDEVKGTEEQQYPQEDKDKTECCFSVTHDRTPISLKDFLLPSTQYGGNSYVWQLILETALSVFAA